MMTSSQPLSTFLFLILPLLANAHTCSEGFFLEATNRNVTQHCHSKSLRSEFAWNFNNNSSRLDIAFGARLESQTAWLAWGLNPRGPHMVGTRALIGIKAALQCHKYNVTDDVKRGCQLLPSDDIGLDVRNFSFVHVPGIGYHVILATVFLSEEYNSWRANVVWQVGDDAAGSEPLMHHNSLAHLDSAETLNLVSGEVVGYKLSKRRQLRIAHGTLNMIGWGIFLPVGVIVARYFRVHPKEWTPYWYYLHVGCQIAGYTLGLIGWIIGLWMGHKSKYFTFVTHRIIGIFIFTFATIQMMALQLKPKSGDEYRVYWNMYHHFLGYALLAVISVNIFQGIKILDTNNSWRWSYVGVLSALGAIVLALEIYSWIKFRLKQEEKKKKKNAQNQEKEKNAQNQVQVHGDVGDSKPKAKGGEPK